MTKFVSDTLISAVYVNVYSILLVAYVDFCCLWRSLFDVTKFVSDASISVHGEDYLMLLGLSVTSLFLFMLKII